VTYRTHTISHLLEAPRELRTVARPGDVVIVDRFNAVTHLCKENGKADTLHTVTGRITTTTWEMDRAAIVIRGRRHVFAYRDGVSVHRGPAVDSYEDVVISGYDADRDDVRDLCALVEVSLSSDTDTVTNAGAHLSVQHFVEPPMPYENYKAGEE
jgi:hypothetical protein